MGLITSDFKHLVLIGSNKNNLKLISILLIGLHFILFFKLKKEKEKGYSYAYIIQLIINLRFKLDCDKFLSGTLFALLKKKDTLEKPIS